MNSPETKRRTFGHESMHADGNSQVSCAERLQLAPRRPVRAPVPAHRGFNHMAVAGGTKCIFLADRYG